MSDPESGRRDPGLDVPIGRVGRRGGRGRWAAAIWAAAMVVVVAPAIGARLAETPEAPRIAVVGPHADPGPVASAAATPRPRAVVRVVAPPARMSGEDGLMGSLVLDLEPHYPFVLWWPGRDYGYMSGQVKS